MGMYGSGVMTVREVKSQRFPIRLPRTRPFLPLSRKKMERTWPELRTDPFSCTCWKERES